MNSEPGYDLVVMRGRHRTYVAGESAKGKEFLTVNYVCGENNVLAISAEHTDELVEDLEKEGLIVKVKWSGSA